jgi:hypothetical protein
MGNRFSRVESLRQSSQNRSDSFGARTPLTTWLHGFLLHQYYSSRQSRSEGAQPFTMGSFAEDPSSRESTSRGEKIGRVHYSRELNGPVCAHPVYQSRKTRGGNVGSWPRTRAWSTIRGNLWGQFSALDCFSRLDSLDGSEVARILPQPRQWIQLRS